MQKNKEGWSFVFYSSGYPDVKVVVVDIGLAAAPAHKYLKQTEENQTTNLCCHLQYKLHLDSEMLQHIMILYVMREKLCVMKTPAVRFCS